MKKRIKIILLEDIKNLGVAGQIVSVSEGYARNNLFPEGLAALATPEVQNKKTKADANQSAATKAETDKLLQLAQSLIGTELILSARLKDGDEIYGSISAKDISKELATQGHLDIKPKQINLAKNLNTIGSQEVEINLSEDVSTSITVTINPEPGSEPSSSDDE